jgi:hypothetical protein
MVKIMIMMHINKMTVKFIIQLKIIKTVLMV